MQLQQFVGETIKAVLEGVRSAQEHAKTIQAKVVPETSHHFGNQSIITDRNNGAIVDKLEFDVAVTATEATSSEAKAGVSVWGVGVGAKGQENAKNETVSRVKFSVPIVYPQQT